VSSPPYRVDFYELGRPPAHNGKTALTIGPKERRVLLLPEVEVAVGEKLETVVALEYKVEEKENGLKSRFEIEQQEERSTPKFALLLGKGYQRFVNRGKTREAL
jgi:hypothetical protein